MCMCSLYVYEYEYVYVYEVVDQTIVVISLTSVQLRPKDFIIVAKQHHHPDYGASTVFTAFCDRRNYPLLLLTL